MIRPTNAVSSNASTARSNWPAGRQSLIPTVEDTGFAMTRLPIITAPIAPWRSMNHSRLLRPNGGCSAFFKATGFYRELAPVAGRHGNTQALTANFRMDAGRPLTPASRSDFVMFDWTIEQDHRRIERLVRPGLGFGILQTARRTLAGYETMPMIRKGQADNIGVRDMRTQAAFVANLFQAAT